jgi:uncharacterized peroxidase-related enzyme
VVSATNHCSYWTTAHGEALRSETHDDPFVDAIKQDYTKVELSAAESGMLDYAVKLTMTPSNVNEEDVVKLRSVGFDDRDILDIIYVICLYNFNDRMADATGIKGHDFLSWDSFLLSPTWGGAAMPFIYVDFMTKLMRPHFIRRNRASIRRD